MIETDALTPILLDALSKKITWLEASSRFDLDELIETFFATRERTLRTLDGLTDEQVAFAAPAHPFWSISESITHLIYSQGFYYNMLLDMSSSQLPHVVEAARGMGEGAQLNVSADELRQRMNEATSQIRVAVDATRRVFDAQKVIFNPTFGSCNYQTWVFLLLGHEVDHLRQMLTMRRLARAEK